MDPYLGQVLLFAGNFAPRGWALCHGQLLAIAQNQALFALLGTTYGGDGQVTFALPDLRGRVPVHAGADLPQGSRDGVEAVNLLLTNLPAHTHAVPATSAAATDAALAGRAPAAAAAAAFGQSGPAVGMAAEAVSVVGNGAALSNMAPSLAMNFIIAVQGIFPARN